MKTEMAIWAEWLFVNDWLDCAFSTSSCVYLSSLEILLATRGTNSLWSLFSQGEKQINGSLVCFIGMVKNLSLVRI